MKALSGALLAAMAFTASAAAQNDAFLGARGSFFDLEARYGRMKERAPSPFIDPDGYKRYVAERAQAFRAELAKQRAGPAPS
ncbi:MAG: hypothetical protein HY049_13130 [Acidobacteria bacterium]|nr:hypothetical protein [Acidobacteriota bacterium]